MHDSQILISLEPRFAEGILEGRKQVELRRRRFRVEPGTVVWMYAKLPIGHVVGCAKIKDVHVGAPAAIWKKYGARTGVSRAEFFEYFRGRREGQVLVLGDSKRLKSPVSLASLRNRQRGFQPPQFFKRLDRQGRLLKALEAG